MATSTVREVTATDFSRFDVPSLKKYLQNRGITISGYSKNSLVQLAKCAEQLQLPTDPNQQNVCVTDEVREGAKCSTYCKRRHSRLARIDQSDFQAKRPSGWKGSGNDG